MNGTWYGPDGRAITAGDAVRLLSDWPGRVVAQDVIPSGPIMVLVVTSFTVAPVHQRAGGQLYADAAPILWETMVTVEHSGVLIGYYRSRGDAEVGHSQVVTHVHHLLQTLHPSQALSALEQARIW